MRCRPDRPSKSLAELQRAPLRPRPLGAHRRLPAKRATHRRVHGASAAVQSCQSREIEASRARRGRTLNFLLDLSACGWMFAMWGMNALHVVQNMDAPIGNDRIRARQHKAR